VRSVATLAVVLSLCAPSVALAGEDDSPWPETESTAAQMAATRSVLGDLEDKAELMDLSVARFDAWQSCLRGVPISEYGDPDRQFGYRYDERDGSGESFMPALAVDHRSRPGREDYLFLDFDRGGDCRSAPPKPGGTAEPASLGGVANLERRVKRLRRTAARLEAASERFDAWESCVSWVPVTEYGDPDGGFGFAFGSPLNYRPALSIDRSDWDDPDYMFLAFVGGDRPGHHCQDEPGEAVD
jgi:hypothetical protein